MNNKKYIYLLGLENFESLSFVGLADAAREVDEFVSLDSDNGLCFEWIICDGEDEVFDLLEWILPLGEFCFCKLGLDGKDLNDAFFSFVRSVWCCAFSFSLRFNPVGISDINGLLPIPCSSGEFACFK